MKGDFSRLTFKPQKHYSSVRMQQGRVQLDADWNEQVDIQLHLLRTQIQDWLGLHGAPEGQAGFFISLQPGTPAPGNGDQAAPPSASDPTPEPDGDGRAEEGDDQRMLLADPETPQALADAAGTAGGSMTAEAAPAPDATEAEPAMPEPTAENGLDGAAGEEPENQENALGRPVEPQPLPDLWIGPGRYYVEGMLCENEAWVGYLEQPHYPNAVLPDATEDHDLLAYLDVWQRHLTAAEDPGMLEPALGGVDTTTRTQTVWQVKLLPVTRHAGGESKDNLPPEWQALLAQHDERGTLRASWQTRGVDLENRLYRVEIHRGGSADQAAFKWSRDNGSVTFRLHDPAPLQAGSNVLTLVGLDRDGYQLQQGDWLEFVDEAQAIAGKAGPLCQVEQVLLSLGQVTVGPASNLAPEELADLKPAHVRRWDQGGSAGELDGGAISLQPGHWQELEDGIEVQFSPDGNYQAGDYWLVPARRLPSSGIEWPADADGEAIEEMPHGLHHSLCPLALLQREGSRWQVSRDLRQLFSPLTEVETNRRQLAQRLHTIEEAVADLRHLLQAEQAEVEQTVQRLLHESAYQNVLDKAGMFQEFASQQDLDAGDVVALDPPTDSIVRANKRNADLVVGVVTQMLSQSVAGARYQVAMYGRLPCKVTGKVEPGDLLVPGDKDGYAKKAGLFAKRGTLIGKVLDIYPFGQEPLPDTVDVLVNLG